MESLPFCKLCLENPASPIVSHIYPKGITKFLKGENKKGKVYTLNTSSLDNQPDFYQDSLKIPYLLCEECENKRLNSVEAPFLGKVYHNIRKPNKRRLFPEMFFLDGSPFRFIPEKEQDPALTHLFVYSIVWRVSIAPYDVEGSKISTSFSEYLRRVLNKYLGSKPKETKAFIDSDRANFPFLPFCMCYEERSSDCSNNFLASLGDEDLLVIFLNDLIILFSLDKSFKLLKKEGFDNCVNYEDRPVKLIQMLPKPWENLRWAMMENFTRLGVKKTCEKGEVPYPLKDDI